MDRRSIITVLASLGAAIALMRCAAPARVEVRGRPADFTLDALVLNPDPAGAPRWRRPARYIVTADGELRVALGPGVSRRTIPRLARTLERDQLDRLWTLAREAGLAEPDGAWSIEWGETWSAPAGEASAVITISANGRRYHNGVAMGASSGLGAPRVEALLDALGELAWVPEG